MRTVLPVTLGLTLIASACVSRATPVRAAGPLDVEATRAEASFPVPLQPLDTVLLVREYLVGQGLTVLEGPVADRLDFRHPFLDDGYRVEVEATDSGTRVRFAGTAPGRDQGIHRRVQELVEGLRRHLEGRRADEAAA